MIIAPSDRFLRTHELVRLFADPVQAVRVGGTSTSTSGRVVGDVWPV
jgi:hypothetical protein